MPDNSPERSRSARAVHVPVMVREVIDALDLSPGQTVVDGTVGAGGHSQHIIRQITPGGRLIGLDRDPMMLEFSRHKLGDDHVHLVHSSYAQLEQILDDLQIDGVDRVLLDLGLSSDQLADRSRGFGFQAGGKLDLRFDTSQGFAAAELLATYDEHDIASLFERYGDERQADKIAAEIVRRRSHSPVQTAETLAALVESIAGRAKRQSSHPATRVFRHCGLPSTASSMNSIRC